MIGLSTQNIFHIFISCLHELGQQKASNFERTFYVLESLATIETCALLVDRAEGKQDWALKHIEDLFECLLSSVR